MFLYPFNCLHSLPNLFPHHFITHFMETKNSLSLSLPLDPPLPITASSPPSFSGSPGCSTTFPSLSPWSSLSVRLLSAQTGQGKFYWSLCNARAPLKVKVNKSIASCWTTGPKPDFYAWGINYSELSDHRALATWGCRLGKGQKITGKVRVQKTRVSG